MSTKAVILVGGDTRGTRFRPISLSTPKVLFPAGGKPLLAHVVDRVAQSGLPISEILLIGFYENSVFDNFIAEVNHKHPDINLRYLREYQALGTAGGLHHFRDQILRGKPERVFVVNADVCSTAPLSTLSQELDSHKDAKGVIMGTKVAKGISSQFGGIIADENNKVLHYVEKPDSAFSDLVNGGLYLFKSSIFDDIAAAKQDHQAHSNSVLDEEDESEKLSIETDLLPQLADEGALYVHVTTDYWRQVKDASSALVANRLYLDDSTSAGTKLAEGKNIRGPVYIDAKARVDPSASIGPNVTICAGAKVGPGACIRDAVIFPRTEIRAHAVVISSILCPNVRVGKWARIEGSPIAISEYASRIIKDGVKVPRTTILAENVIVSDEVHVQNSVVLPHKDIKADVKNEIIM